MWKRTLAGALAWMFLTACGAGLRSGERAYSIVTVEPKTRYEIEVYNPTGCPADVRLSNTAGTIGRSLGTVPGRGRLSFIVVSPQEGVVSALALAENRTECDRGVLDPEVRIVSPSGASPSGTP